MNKKTISIIIGGILFLSGGVYIALQPGDLVAPQAIENVEFEELNVQVIQSNIEFATTTDENEDVIKTGLKIPITYNFPVATSTGYIIEEINESIEMNFGAYNQCRGSGKSKTVCIAELNDDIQQNIDTFKENKARELEELKSSQYFNELDLIDF